VQSVTPIRMGHQCGGDAEHKEGKGGVENYTWICTEAG
jgi:hypothetical protein